MSAHNQCSPDIVEVLIENLIQASYEYEQAEGSAAKYLRGEFGKARHAIREHIAQLQYEAGMYKSLYENASHHDVAQQPVDSTALLANCDKLHDLGFEGGWNAAVEECAKIAETAYSLMFPKPANRITAENAGHAAAAAIRDLALTSTQPLPVVTKGLVPDPNSASGYSLSRPHGETGQ